MWDTLTDCRARRTRQWAPLPNNALVQHSARPVGLRENLTGVER